MQIPSDRVAEIQMYRQMTANVANLPEGLAARMGAVASNSTY